MANLRDLSAEISYLNSYSELRTFISKYKPETYLLDWKENLSDNQTGKTFASFANVHGGIVVYGVSRNGNILGLPISARKEFLKQLSEKITRIAPRIPDPNIELFHTIQFGRPIKAIFFIRVNPSLSSLKPHVWEEKIPLRGNGNTIYPKSGEEIRAMCMFPPFNPWHMEQVEVDLIALKNFRVNASGIPVLSFITIKAYLERILRETQNSIQDKVKYENCLLAFQSVERTIHDIQVHPFRSAAAAQANGKTITHLEASLGQQIDECIRLYGVIFG